MSNNKDTLGDRMKCYEDAYRFHLPRRSNVIARIDGKAFHTYTRNCDKPYDQNLCDDMDGTAYALMEQIQGAKLAYVQSDEINILITDYDSLETDAWFGNNIQKMCSISASIATAEFNLLQINRVLEALRPNKIVIKPANFDSRVYIIPELSEVANLFLWRCQDASRNSIQMLARSHYSSKELHKKNTNDIHNMLLAKGINWNFIKPRFKRGGIVFKRDGKLITTSPEKNDYVFWLDLVKEVTHVNIEDDTV